MRNYQIEAILWEDHMRVERELLSKNPDNEVIPTLSVGLVLQETDKVVVLASNIERYKGSGHADCSYLIIYKGSIVNRQAYGAIPIRRLSKKGGD